MEAPEPGTLRWAVCLSGWQPNQSECEFLFKLLPEHEINACLRYLKDADRRRSLISKLLQRKCAEKALGVPFEDVKIQRCKGGKPFVVINNPGKKLPNFNYNVSHEGEYVVLASEPVCICGVDVCAPQQVRQDPATSSGTSAFHDAFKEQLAPSEWEALQAVGPDLSATEGTFQRLWSLKEAYTKARGDGLGFHPLSRAAFEVQLEAAKARGTAHVVVDGAAQPRWRFFLELLENNHWVAVARGPPECVVDAWGGFKAGLRRPVISNEELKVHLDATSPPFTTLPVVDLLPHHRRSEYLRRFS